MKVAGRVVVLCVMAACLAGSGASWAAACDTGAAPVKTTPGLPTIRYDYFNGSGPGVPRPELRYKQPMVVSIENVPTDTAPAIAIKFEDKKLFENIDVKQWQMPDDERKKNQCAERTEVVREYIPKGDWLTVRVTRNDNGAETELWTDEFPVQGRVAVTPSVGFLYVSLQDEDAQGRAASRAPMFPQAAVSIFKVRPEGGGQTSGTFGFATGDHTLYFAGVGRMFGNDIRVVPGINFVYGQVDRPNADGSGVEAQWKAGWGLSLSFVVSQF